MPKPEKCKQCGHLQSKHMPYYDGSGWVCTVDNCSRWDLCKRPKNYKKFLKK